MMQEKDDIDLDPDGDSDVKLRAKDLRARTQQISKVPVLTLLEQYTIQELHRPDEYSFVHQDIQMDLNGGFLAGNYISFGAFGALFILLGCICILEEFSLFCKDGESKMSYLVCGTEQCLKGKALQIGGAIGGMCVCVIFLMMQIPLNLFLFDKNYKRGGHLSTYSGSSSAIEYII
ncbi:MAG: hypothetical protein EZS28_042997, partial [Streblomastix strix]